MAGWAEKEGAWAPQECCAFKWPSASWHFSSLQKIYNTAVADCRGDHFWGGVSDISVNQSGWRWG